MEILENEKALKNFWSKVEKTEECWNWVGCCNTKGYGNFGVCGKVKKSHRVSFELYHKRPIADEMLIMHSCDNPGCCNPCHLSEGSNKDNSDDKFKKKRNFSLSGQNHPNSKLTEEQVLEIRSKYSPGNCNQRKVGEEYNVNQKIIWNIIHRKLWTHI